MSTELATIPAPLTDKMEYAKALAHSNLLPEQYRGNPANLLYALEYADALGVAPINAITSIHVIKGKPTASADLIAGLVRKAGHKLRISGDDTFALAQIIRQDDPDFTYEARWDLAKARAAGLQTQTWKQYPAAMLRARAITEVARMGASDALFGCIYTPEEVGAQVDADGTPVVQAGTSPMQRLNNVAPIAEFDEPTDVTDAEVIEDGPDTITPAQIKKLNTVVSKLGLDRDQKINGLRMVTGREVESSKDLTKAEANAAIDSLEAALAAKTVTDELGATDVQA